MAQRLERQRGMRSSTISFAGQVTDKLCSHFMAFGRGILSSILNKKNINDDDDNYKNRCSDQERNFLKNGSILLEELIVFSNGRYNIPIRRFSVEELSQATNGFCSDQIVIDDSKCYKIYEGSFEERLILIMQYDLHPGWSLPEVIRDIVVTTLMSSHKNVLKLIGCCLDFKFPAPVYEYGGSIELLSKLLYEREGDIVAYRPLTWKSRLKIANGIAYAVVYMHTAFPTPIIHRNLKPSNIIIDQCGVAKLLDFKLSISIPPGKTQVEDKLVGTYGFADPEYMRTCILTVKSDVYGFGMILLELLTGKRAIICKHGDKHEFLSNCVKDYVDEDRFSEVVDPRILEEKGGFEQEQQLQDVVALALRCIQENRDERPEMIEVAKELKRIIKSVSPSLPQP